MRALVIDNDSKVREGLISMIAKFCPQVSGIEQAGTIQAGLEAISTFEPNLVFLDVELDEGTGMDLLSKLKEYTFHVVFITAHNKYAVDAFKFSAIDFILKPIGLEDLMNAVQKALAKTESADLLKQLSILKENMISPAPRDKKIVLKDSGNIYFVKVDDIVHCKSDGGYTEFHFIDGSKVVMSVNLKEYETLLEPFGFIRTHHSYLVNINSIVRFDKSDGGTLVLNNGDVIPVSQRKKERVLELILKL